MSKLMINSGPSVPQRERLPPPVLWLKQMAIIREFEEQVFDLYSRGEISGIAHLSIGQEAVPVGVCACLRAEDNITSTHRGHGHCLAKGAEVGRMFAELLGRVDGYCRGKGGSMHIANQEMGNLGANAIVGGGIPIATGAALSAKRLKTDRVSVCFFGDGAVNQGVLYEALNIAALWKLPVIYVCENNQYGEYTPMQSVTAGNIRKRAEAFDVLSEDVDGMDVLAVEAAARRFVDRARSGNGPGFLVCDTYRHSGHGMSDRNRPYRTREEEKQWREERDPIDRLQASLRNDGVLNDKDWSVIQSEVKLLVQAGIEFAKGSPYPPADEVSEHVYSD